MIDRRGVLIAGGAVLASAAIPGASFASVGTLRVVALRFGSLNWLLETIRAEGLAEKAGLKLEIMTVATNQAGPVALLAGGADVIVSDWTWALRQRAFGEKLKFAPYSSALGAVMVPEGSPIAKLADLEGKKLGVAGGAIDKSWLLLRAYSRKTMGKDVSEVAEPIFGAAPLLTEAATGASTLCSTSGPIRRAFQAAGFASLSPWTRSLTPSESILRRRLSALSGARRQRFVRAPRLLPSSMSL
jgi:NitT/TauT family transport system substrate-binding protein